MHFKAARSPGFDFRIRCGACGVCNISHVCSGPPYNQKHVSGSTLVAWPVSADWDKPFIWQCNFGYTLCIKCWNIDTVILFCSSKLSPAASQSKPAIHRPPLNLVECCGGLEPIPADFGWEAETSKPVIQESFYCNKNLLELTIVLTPVIASILYKWKSCAVTQCTS